MDYAGEADINLDQAGYQAMATGCLEEKDGLQLINDMLVCCKPYDNRYWTISEAKFVALQ